MADDYKDEFLLRLIKSQIYKELIEKCADKDTEVVTLVNEAVSYACQRTKTIIKHMGEYTLHDGDHLFRVLNLMEKLLSKETIKQLSAPELMLLILSAFFHDIGMAPDEKDVLAWKKVWDASPQFENKEEEGKYNEFYRYYSARPDQKEIINQLINEGKHTNAETIKAYLITDFIRNTHAERAREIVAQDWEGKIVYRTADLTVEFAEICYSHNEDPLSLIELDKNFLCASDTVACLPLIGVILRLADILDFDAKRTPAILYSHLYVRHPVSVQEWQKHRSVEAWEITANLVQFNAVCNHPAIEASIHKFCDVIDHELSVCNNVITALNDYHTASGREILIKLPLKVNRDKIRTKKNVYSKPLYIYRNTQFNLSKKQVIDLLMGTKLYGDPQVALRELLQNSIDACLLRQAQQKKWGELYEPKITVKYYEVEGDIILEVDDNGTGMDQYIIDNYYSKVGSSFYKSTDFYNLKSESNADFIPTSRFGIGILSSFMVADVLEVDTKRVYGPHKSSDALNVVVEGQESIFWIQEGSRETPGTTTKLTLRKAKNPWDKLGEDEFITSVENIIPNPPFTINIETSSHTTVKDQYSFSNVLSQSLKDFTWDDHENVKLLNVSLNNKDSGIVGTATVAILESQGKPVKQIDVNSTDVEINNETFTLDKSISLSVNSISESATSISVDDEGCIEESSSTRDLAKSKSRLSLHGIEVPSSLFPDYWESKENQVKILWPFPLLLIVDICGNRDLDLNSSRTQIIMSEKWVDFEEELAFQICSELVKSVDAEYWQLLKNIFSKTTKNEVFLRALNCLQS